ncbi:MAG TPA: hypothetical protein VNR36_05105 [Pseudolysinimonas sp.]|nr:hypothetical protein [Pseudolysinimonas sp.]
MTFVEPTRRLPYSARFSYDGRYGAALVAVLLGGYLLLSADVARLALGLAGVIAFPPEQTIVLLLQYLFAIAVIVFGFAVSPAASGRRIIAIVLVLVLLVIWTMLYVARLTGSAAPLPFASGFLTAPSFIVPLALSTGWLIVRERPAITYPLLILSLFGGVVPFLMVLAAQPSAAMQLVQAPLALALGVGIAWLARLIAGAVQAARDRSGYVEAPPAV